MLTGPGNGCSTSIQEAGKPMFNTRHPISKLLFSLLTSLAIGACVPAEEGGGSSSSDAKEARQQIQAANWQTSDCLRDSAGLYFKGLYRFTDEGKINSGYQTYQDSACTTRANDSRMPDSFRADYEVKEEETLFDGTRGFGLDLFIQGAAVNGYLSLKDDKTLCFSNNMVFRANELYATLAEDASYMDYDHCLSVFDSSNDPNPNPDPVTNANLQGIWVLGTQCRVNNSGDHFYWIMQFRDDGHVFQAYAFFDNASCSGTTTSTTLAELDPVLTYTDLGEATLSDGRQGRQMRLSQGANNFEGYYIIENQNELCVSHSFTLTGSGLTSTDIDYNNCFTRYQE
ncbi:MAG: hypothetical protein ABW068_14075 [Candidatus Thiodiazotropha sp.]